MRSKWQPIKHPRRLEEYCANESRAVASAYALQRELCQSADKERRTCYPSLDRLASELHLLPHTINSLRWVLIDLGELVVYPRAYNGRSWVYYIPHYPSEEGYAPAECRWQGVAHICRGLHTPNIHADLDTRQAKLHPVAGRQIWIAYQRRHAPPQDPETPQTGQEPLIAPHDQPEEPQERTAPADGPGWHKFLDVKREMDEIHRKGRL